MWRTPSRVLLQWLNRVPTTTARTSSFLQPISPGTKVLLGVPVVLGGAGVVLVGSQAIANTATKGENRRKRLLQPQEGTDGKTANKPKKSSSKLIGNHGDSEVELLLWQLFMESASCEVQGQKFMTAADFVNFVRGGDCNAVKTSNDKGRTGLQGVQNNGATTDESKKNIWSQDAIGSHCSQVGIEVEAENGTSNIGLQIGLGVESEHGVKQSGEGVPKVGKQTNRVPKKWQTSSHFFRDLGEDGLLELSDFVFLLHVLTTSPEFFKPIYKVLTNGGAAFLTADDFNYMKKGLSPKVQGKVSNKVNGKIPGKVRRQWSFMEAPWRAPTGLVPALCQGSVLRMGLSTTRSGSSSEDGRCLVSRIFSKDAATDGDPDMSCISTHLFGTHGRVGGIRFLDLKRFILNVHREVLEVEYSQLAGDKGYLNLEEFGDWAFRFAAADRKEKSVDLKNRRHGNKDVHVTIDDLQSLDDVIRYHLKDVINAMTLYTVLTPSGMTSFRDVQEVIQLGSGMRLEAKLCDVMFQLFSTSGDGKRMRFDVDLFSDVMHRRRSFGLPLKVKEDKVVTLEGDDGGFEEEEL